MAWKVLILIIYEAIKDDALITTRAMIIAPAKMNPNRDRKRYRNRSRFGFRFGTCPE